MPKCHKNAPYLCVPEASDRPGFIGQCCCNDWTCPRCGELRAKHEYGRMVVGAREVAKGNTLYFMTITCNGSADVNEQERLYLKRTNALMTWIRQQAKKAGREVYYASVTERQKRGAPHSHYLISFVPTDTFEPLTDYEQYSDACGRVFASHPSQAVFSPASRDEISLLDLYSEALVMKALAVGLGSQVRLSYVDSIEACSRYIAKYLFKQTMTDVWPKGWRRVRYSNNWPKLPEKHNPSAFPVMSHWDWLLAGDSGELQTVSRHVASEAYRHGLTNVTLKLLDTV